MFHFTYSKSLIICLSVLSCYLITFAQQPTLRLPYLDGNAVKCVQGAGGTTSHTSTTTRHDLDFDLDGGSNSTDEVVVAGASGIAYVVPDAHPGERAGFGNHVNIDLGPVNPNNPAGDHYFVLAAHLKTFLIRNGQSVSQGQPIGMEGCTGLCFGDHVHYGLHQGNPQNNAGNSISITADQISARDVTTNGQFVTLTSDQFIGDLSTGHTYQSNNTYPTWCTNTTYWSFTNDSRCWALGSNGGAVTSSFDSTPAWIIKINNDPQIVSPPISMNASDFSSIEIRMASVANNTQAQVFFATDSSPNFSPDKSYTRTINNNGGYYTYSIALSDNAQWRGRITRLRFDPVAGGTNEYVGIQSIELHRGSAPVVSSNLTLTPSGPYISGARITARFTIVNRGTAPITFDTLLTGGRLNGDESCAGGCPDFAPERSVTLNPGQSHQYSGDQVLSRVGSYRFFVAFKTLDGGWNTNVATDPGVVGSLNTTVSGDGGGAIDEFGPNLTITSHSDGQLVSAPTITLSGTASDAGRGESGISSVTVNSVRANGDTAAVSNTANWSRDLILNPGANTITVVATDNAPTPNQTSQTITLNLSGSGGGAGVIAAGLSNPTDIATDGNEVFWTDWGSYSLKKVSVNGGAVTTLFNGTYNTSGVALDSNYVYFGYSGDVKKIPKAGGTAVTLASNSWAVSHLAVDRTNVYWTSYSEGTVKKVSIDGGGVTTLASGSSGPWGITLAGNNVYWTEQNNPGSIKYVSINGGTVNTLANNSNSLGIDSDGTNIYWTENVSINSGKVNKIPLFGGTPTAIASSLDRPSDVVVDSANAYWIGGDQNGYVAQVSLSGGSVTTLASGLSSPVAIAADTSNVYWIERTDGASGTGTLKKVAKGSVPPGPGGVPIDFAWQYKQSMPVSTWGAAAVTYNNQIYVLGGSGGFLNNYRYTPATNSWEQKTSMPGYGILEGGAAVIGSKIYAIGNYQDASMRIYDTAADQWSTGAAMSAQARRGVNVASFGGKILVLGGCDFSLSGINSVRMYDPGTNVWSDRSPIPTARGFAAVAVVNNLIYVIGGYDASSAQGIKDVVEVYDPSTDSWSTKSPLLTRTYITATAVLGNRIYVLGGGDGSRPLNLVQEYNPGSDSWRSLSQFHTARYQHVAGTVNNKIYLIGGPDASVEEGTPTGYAPSLSVTPRSQTVYVGSVGVVTISISAAQTTDTRVTMSSSNSSIASVSDTIISAGSTTASNVVWGNSAGGPVTIHAKLPDSLAAISDDVTVTVVNRPPDVTTTAAGTVTSTTAILGGYINPNETVTNAWFEYGTDSTLSGYYSSSPQLLGAGNSGVSVYENLSGLSPNTVYYFRAVASSNAGTSKGSILSFPTSQLVAPSVTTQAATGIATTTAALNANVNPNGLATNAWFEWGTDPSLASNSATTQQSIGSGNSAAPVIANLTGLTSNTTYYFRVVGSNSAGSSRGSTLSFQTAPLGATVRAEYNLRGDFDGDGKSDIAVWRPSTGVWYINNSTGSQRIQSWGAAGDIPVPADYDGDGKTDLAIYRPSTGEWYSSTSSDGLTRIQSWGLSDDVPVPGDYDGDGKADIAVWRPSSGLWFVLSSSNGSGSVQGWGTLGDMPVPGDYDGDGKSDLAVWRPSSGQWYIINSSNGSQRTQGWGTLGDMPVGGDYDGDGKADLAVFRPSTGVWYIVNSLNNSQRVQGWGTNGDIPVACDYDGDTKRDIAVWRPSSGIWYIINSQNNSQRIQGWGTLGDVPVSGVLIIR